MATKKKQSQAKQVETLTHKKANRTNIPTAEYESVVPEEQKTPIQVAYERRNRDLDPQLTWRGKDEQDWSDLVVNAPPLYIQEKVHPKVLIDDLIKRSKERTEADQDKQFDLFADFNGLPDSAKATEFYQHDANWTNRLILGDSLQVMASLAEREGLRGKVQCIYLDPPYGISFNSNFQWSTTTRDVRDGKTDHITREPEQVKAFRDTWRDGIHSYLTYLRDRLTVARDLLSESGSVFVQIGDENVHRVRIILDEIFGDENFAALITFRKKMMPLGSDVAEGVSDYILWYSKNRESIKSHPIFSEKISEGEAVWSQMILPGGYRTRLSKNERENHSLLSSKAKVYQPISLLPAQYRPNQDFKFNFEGRNWNPPKKSSWKTDFSGMSRLKLARRIHPSNSSLRYVLFHADYPVGRITNLWADSSGATQQVYVVQTNTEVVKRCILMATDPGDLVLDPTCGSGTTATVAEQWGRRWITIDTSRVALALTRARLMGAKYPYYLLADSPEGQKKEAEISRTTPSNSPTYGNIRQGFVYERVPHITLGAITKNSEIDVIWEKYQPQVTPALENLNNALKGHQTPFQVTTGGRDGKTVDFTANGTVKLPSGEEAPANALLEWEIPREKPEDWPKETQPLLDAFWEARINRQKEIDKSIAANAEQEILYDKPYEDKSKVRVAGPFTVESLSPHRVLTVNENDELVDGNQEESPDNSKGDFASIILEHLKTSGVQQAHKEDKINFTSINGWPGEYICAEGTYLEGESETEKRAGIFIGPEFGTVSRPDLVAAAREAGDAGFDVLISCAFNYDAHSAEFNKLGRIPVLKAHMNAELHMADDLKNTGSGNLFVIFGEPDIEIKPVEDNQIQVQIHGVDVFHPQSGEVRSSGPDGIACWFIDTDYNEESFFVRHAYFLGTGDPYKSLKTTLKSEIDQEGWDSLYSEVSRPFEKPASGRIAVKVINHLGDEVMKVFNVD
ncbi:MAG: site-specific DNA-methyltransferase [Cyanobacteria bacterium]|jgi:adenine-specific DNA-methyltransferase|nr:site-specific DNA-methyltransferase [Cyanobacteria bacterium GSL.Bin1]